MFTRAMLLVLSLFVLSVPAFANPDPSAPTRTKMNKGSSSSKAKKADSVAKGKSDKDAAVEGKPAKKKSKKKAAGPAKDADKDEADENNAFKNTELLVGHGVKANSGSKMFSFGLTVSFAPLNVLLSSQKDTIINEGIADACKGAANPAQCQADAKASADAAMDALGSVPDSQWDEVSAAAGDMSKLSNTLVEAGLSQEQAGSVTGYVGKIPEGSRTNAVELSRQLASQEGSLFLVEPHMELNFQYVSMRTMLPLAALMFEDETDWVFGNLTLDLEFGSTWGGGVASTGLSGGLMAYLPTGSTKTAALAVTDLFQAPKYGYQYLTLAPYLAAGVDGTLASLQVHGAVVNSIPVRDTTGLETMTYLRWGTGVTLLQQYSPVAIIGEINGLTPLSNADVYDAIFAVAGLQLNLFIMRAAVAVQLPLVTPDSHAMSGIAGVDMGEMAKYSIIGRLMFSF